MISSNYHSRGATIRKARKRGSRVKRGLSIHCDTSELESLHQTPSVSKPPACRPFTSVPSSAAARSPVLRRLPTVTFLLLLRASSRHTSTAKVSVRNATTCAIHCDHLRQEQWSIHRECSAESWPSRLQRSNRAECASHSQLMLCAHSHSPPLSSPSHGHISIHAARWTSRGNTAAAAQWQRQRQAQQQLVSASRFPCFLRGVPR